MNKKPRKDFICTNKRTGRIGEYLQGTWFGDVILLKEIETRALLSEIRKHAIYDDDKAFKNYEIVGEI